MMRATRECGPVSRMTTQISLRRVAPQQNPRHGEYRHRQIEAAEQPPAHHRVPGLERDVVTTAPKRPRSHIPSTAGESRRFLPPGPLVTSTVCL